MSRTLAELLHAPELTFRSRLRQLEAASGLPRVDVRLTAHVIQAGQVKMKALGLDAHDTDPHELYAALNQRYVHDNAQLLRGLARSGNLQGDAHEVMSVVYHALSGLPLPQQALAVKPSVIKKLLKASQPKQTMRQLGYRSVDSLLKHEPLAAVQAAAELFESPAWQKQYAKGLSKLSTTDFESRPLAIVYANHVRWQKVAAGEAFRRRHHIVAVPLSASLVLLPYSQDSPRAATLSSLVLAVTAINHLAAASSYLKLHQMRADFAQAVQQLKNGQATPLLELLGEPVSWQLVQRYYHRFNDLYRPEIFEPHLQPTDFAWLSLDAALARLAPQLAFWHGAGTVGFMKDGQSVSFNLHDIALNVVNAVPFEQRIESHFRQALWQELMLGYLQPKQIEQALLRHMQPALEPITIDKEF